MTDVQPQHVQEVRLVRLPEIMARTTLRKTKIYDMVKKGEFPRPRKEGRASVWPNADLEAWISARAS